jgi:hypothetical protein
MLICATVSMPCVHLCHHSSYHVLICATTIVMLCAHLCHHCHHAMCSSVPPLSSCHVFKCAIPHQSTIKKLSLFANCFPCNGYFSLGV